MTDYFYRTGRLVGDKPLYNVTEHRAEVRQIKTCTRCGGGGGSSAWAHTGWTCFDCGGVGHLGHKMVPVYSAEKLAKLEAAAEKRQAKAAKKRQETMDAAAAVRQANLAAFERDNVEFLKIARDFAGDSAFIADVLATAERKQKITPRQFECVMEACRKAAKRRQEEANAIDVPRTDERVEITGRVLTAKWVENQYGGSLKMLVKDDRGFKVWGSCPSALEGDPDGLRVTFTARLERSTDDPKFGFFSRPTKASYIETTETKGE